MIVILSYVCFNSVLVPTFQSLIVMVDSWLVVKNVVTTNGQQEVNKEIPLELSIMFVVMPIAMCSYSFCILVESWLDAASFVVVHDFQKLLEPPRNSTRRTALYILHWGWNLMWFVPEFLLPMPKWWNPNHELIIRIVGSERFGARGTPQSPAWGRKRGGSVQELPGGNQMLK